MKNSQAQIGPAKICSLQTSSGQIDIAQAGLAEIGKAQVSFRQVGLAEIRSDMRVRLTPLIPLLGSLFKNIKMSLLCHCLCSLPIRAGRYSKELYGVES